MQHCEEEVFGAEMLVVELSALDLGHCHYSTLSLRERARDLAGAWAPARLEQLFEIVAEGVEGNSGVQKHSDRGVLTLPQNADEHMHFGDIVVAHGRGEGARDRQRHAHASSERRLAKHVFVSHQANSN